MSCSQDCGKLGKAALAAIVLRAALAYLVHSVLLNGIYSRPHYATLWNPMDVMKSRMPAMLLSHVLFGFAFALIYTRGYEESKPPLGQGLRYGFWMGLFFATGTLIQYAVYPVSIRLMGAWILDDVVSCMIIGAAVALLYKPQPH